MIKFTIFGINLSVSVAFFGIYTLMIYIDKTGLMTASLAAVAVHEFGHIIAMKTLKCLPKEIGIRR